MFQSRYPKISVVIYCYNFEKFIKECIESILIQTLRPYEIIICDDHSSDKSWDIISEYSTNYPDLIKSYRHCKNIGMAKNGNFGFKKIKGELISWIDGDDRWLPTKLEHEWNALIKYPSAKIAYSNVYIIDLNGERQRIWDDGKFPVPPTGDAFVHVFSRRFFPNSASVFRNHLMYRSVFDKVGYLDEDLEIYVDWDFKIRATAKFQIVYSDVALIEYRTHKQGISNSPREILYRDMIRVYEKNINLANSLSSRKIAAIKCCIEKELTMLMPGKKTRLKVPIQGRNIGQINSFHKLCRSVDNINKHQISKIKMKNGTRAGENLIFLISQPRAGSTLLQRILGGHPEIHTTAEPWIMLHPLYALKKNGLFAEFDSNLAGQGLEDFLMQIPEGTALYIQALREMASVLYNRMIELSGRKYFLDKTPRYYYVIPELYQVFPKAKFIFLFRNPMAVMSSTLSTWFENRPQNLKNSLNYHDLTKGANYLVEGIELVGKDAVVVHYEELVKNPNLIINEICDKIGIRFNKQMLDYGKHPAPKGRFGDAFTIHKHSKPVFDFTDKWIENLTRPDLFDFANEYLSLLGSDLIKKMDYSYTEIENKLNSAIALNESHKNNLRATNLALEQISFSERNLDINAPSVLNKSNKLTNTSSKIKVSAIVSTYNSKRFIRGCLQDLVDQTLFSKGEIEIVVIESGSQQAEGEIVQEFQHKFPNIKYIRTEQHETLYAAWNRGIKAATGKYITTANTDDRHRKDAFERMVNVLEERPDVALVYADVIKTETENETFEHCTAVGAYHWYDWDRNILLEEGCFIGPQPMWRRSVHDDYGYFDESLVSSGDYEFWLRISQSYSFFHIQMPLGLYLIRPDSIEHVERDTKIREDAKIRFMYQKAAKEKKLIRGKPIMATQMEMKTEDLSMHAKLSHQTSHRKADNGKRISGSSDTNKINQGGIDVENYEKMYQGIQPLLNSSNPEDAIAALKNLVDSFPDFAQAHNDLGVCYYRAGEKQTALRHYEQAVQLAPGNITFKKNLADFYYVEQSRVEDALKLYVDVLAIEPEDIETLLITGHICIALERFDDAEVFYNRVLEVEPWNADAREILEKLQNRVPVTTPAPEAEKTVGKTAAEMYQQAQSLMEGNDPEAVIRALEDILETFPGFALAHNDLGVLYYNIGNKDKALTHYEQAARLEADNITFKKNLADFYFVEQNRVEDALQLYVDVLALQPEDVETLLITGHICVSLHKFDDAKVFYNRVLEIEPWNADARQNLETLESKRQAV